MRTFATWTFSALLSLAALPLFAQPDAAELLKNPQYAAKDRKPVFKHLTAEEVRATIKVTSGRDSAAFGFNNASVEVHLPRVDNSNWIDETFSAPKLFDKKQREVKFEKEQGIYDHERWSTEIRFTGLDNKPVDFAKAAGSVRIKYPLVMKTISLKKSETKKALDAGLRQAEASGHKDPRGPRPAAREFVSGQSSVVSGGLRMLIGLTTHYHH